MIVHVRTELEALYRRWGYVETGTAPYDRSYSHENSRPFHPDVQVPGLGQLLNAIRREGTKLLACWVLRSAAQFSAGEALPAGSRATK